MTNLFNFLQRIQQISNADNCDLPAGPISINFYPDDIAFLNQYLQDPGAIIQFKATKTGEENDQGEPYYAQDFVIAGEPHELFMLLTEAAMKNPLFCDMLFAAFGFMTDHVKTCKDCQDHLFEARENFEKQQFDYTFKPHAK